MKRATCNLSLQATTQHLCRYGNLSKLTMHSLFTPAQKSVQLTGPRSRRAQEVSLSFATPQSNSSKAVGLHHQHVCYYLMMNIWTLTRTPCPGIELRPTTRFVPSDQGTLTTTPQVAGQKCKQQFAT